MTRSGVVPYDTPHHRLPHQAHLHTRRWQRLRARVIREAGGRCELCGSTERLTGDHIVSPLDGGAPFDRANVRCLCFACNRAKG